MSDYDWNGGGNYLKAWGEHLPTDAAVRWTKIRWTSWRSKGCTSLYWSLGQSPAEATLQVAACLETLCFLSRSGLISC